MIRWLILNRPLGTLVVTIKKVIKDVFYIFLIYLIFLFAFTVTFHFMFQPFYRNEKGNYKLHQDNLVTLRGAFDAMFWSILDPGQSDYAAVLNNTGSCYRDNSVQASDFDFNCLSGEFSHTMSRVFWGIYQFIIVVIVINILIAMSE